MSISPLLIQLPTTIGTLAQEVIPKCENRIQDMDRAYKWVRDSLLEITTHTDYRDDFDELEMWGEFFTLTPGQAEYDFANILPVGADPVTLTPVPVFNMATLSVMLYVDPPTNSRTIQLSSTNYQAVDKGMSSARGAQPAEWFRFADTICFNPVPNKAYQVRARILRMHPINDYAPQLTTILVNRDWHEIIVWGAVERGFMELLEFDKAAAVHTLLHGDPKYPTKPGLLQGLKKRRKREAWRQTGALRPIVRRYGY